mmetsp:Transcript_33648/g.88514  ORF Transcript_33648/g.88514 Transcript_33648/m.88514 type:complete len:206 (+) Transcript_33648:703-1320(+)
MQNGSKRCSGSQMMGRSTWRASCPRWPRMPPHGCTNGRLFSSTFPLVRHSPSRTTLRHGLGPRSRCAYLNPIARSAETASLFPWRRSPQSYALALNSGYTSRRSRRKLIWIKRRSWQPYSASSKAPTSSGLPRCFRRRAAAGPVALRMAARRLQAVYRCTGVRHRSGKQTSRAGKRRTAQSAHSVQQAPNSAIRELHTYSQYSVK